MSKSIKFSHKIPSLSSLEKINCYLNEQKDRCSGELIEKDLSPPFYKPKFDTNREIITPPFYRSKLSSQSIPQVSYDLDTEAIITGVEDIKLIQSLSSSPSWSDDNDGEGSRKVQEELRKMDRVLRGVDPIPLHYDVDEYKQWMETFPNISLFGDKGKGPYEIWKENQEIQQDIVEPNGIQVPYEQLSQYKKEIKKAVIENIYENILIRLNHESTPSSSRVKKKPHISDINKTQLYLNDCLKSSPFSNIIGDKYTRTCSLSRNNSREENSHFNSLPIMEEGVSRKSAKPFDKFNNETPNGISRKKIRKGILPPIHDKRSFQSIQFRSTSAMPIYSSLLSTRKVNIDSKLLSGKSRNVPQH